MPIIAVVLILVLALLVIWSRLGRMPSPERFLEVHGLAVNPESSDLAYRFLYRQRWFRLLGAWTAMFLVVGTQLTMGRAGSIGTLHLAAVVAGSALGVAWGSRPIRNREGSTRSASLAVRDVADFETPPMVRAERIVAGIGVVVGLIGGLVAWRAGDRDGAVLVGASMLGAVLAWLLIGRLQRSVVLAPRPPIDGDLVRVDNARRSSTVLSLHHCVMALFFCAGIVAVGSIYAVDSRPTVVENGGAVTSLPVGSTIDRTEARDGQTFVYVTEPGHSGTRTYQFESGGNVRVESNSSLLPLLAILALVGAAIGEWIRVRTAPYHPRLVQPGTTRVAVIGGRADS